ncbi:MAG: phospholipid carrier-dependent glycosyltransferase [Bacteroidetes bacterium]|nr:MAG: phospholipid carrier-dependent glycosyltransferase [Bacteroidota bacterium]
MAKKKNLKAGSKRKKKPAIASKPAWTSKLVFRDVASDDEAWYKKIFKISAGVALVLMIALALGSGMNGDDSFQNDYSVKIIDFYTSMGKDTSCFHHPKGPIQYYGGLFELTSGVINKSLGLTPDDWAFHDVRHVLNAIFGFFAMLFVGLLAKEIGGWRLGLMAFWMIFLSPRFLGHSLMNPKDIPFAMGYIMAIYYLARLLRQLPAPPRSTLAGLAAGIGIAFGMRVGGLLIVAYVGMFLGLAFILKYGWRGLTERPRELGQYALWGAIPSAAGLFFGLLVWPYGLVDPLHHVPETLREFSKLSVNIRSLFEGEMIFGGDVPIDYLPKWLGMTLPVFTLLGLAGFFVFIKKIFQTYTPVYVFLVLFTGFFPFLYVMAKGSTLHDGWRHTLFGYTPLVIVAALAWDYAFRAWQSNKKITWALAGILAITALEPAAFIVRNHHYPYIYFNVLSGGLKGAYGSYETDYWGVSLRQAIEWMEKEGLLREDLEQPVTIVSNFSYNLQKYLNKKYGGKVKTGYVRYRQRYDKDWDYALFLSRFVRGSHIKEGVWPPQSSVLHTIKADGIPLVIIMKKTDDHLFKGVQAARKQNWAEAYPELKAGVEKHPDDEIGWTELARTCINLQKLDEAKNALDNALRIEPENLQANNLLGNYYMLTGNLAQAEATFFRTFEFEPKNSVGYYYLATIKQQQNDLSGALEMALKSIEVNPRFKQGYALVATLYEQSGDAARAQLYREAMGKIK